MLCVLLLSTIAAGATPSSVTLFASPNPAELGEPVALTATVTSGATGKVTFYDGTTILGISTISGTQAVLDTVLLPSGNRSLRAYYSGDGVYAPSSSAIVPHSVVAGASLGLKPTIIMESSLGTVGSVAVVADFNGDLMQDIAAFRGPVVQVFLGNGNGTMQVSASISAGGGVDSIAAADFNGDGKSDLVFRIFTIPGGVVKIALGNGDGTFQAATTATPFAVNKVSTGDLNGDGKADIVVGAWNTNAIGILLGNGDGTFQNIVTYPAPALVDSIVVNDLNGDGKADLAVACSSAQFLTIFIGNGDGTVQAAQNFSGGSDSKVLVINDINGDGKGDAMLTGSSTGSLSVLLGNGDGTFQAAVQYGASFVTTAAAGDLDGDGKLDLALSGSVVLFGNGDGTFQPATAFGATSQATTFVVGEFNGDGKTDERFRYFSSTTLRCNWEGPFRTWL